MQKEVLTVKKLAVKAENKEILKGVDLVIREGEVHAVMGPNGSGKSTLVHLIAGNPDYSADSGEILFQGKDISKLKPDERATKGIFLSFQHPVEIPGVNVASFLRMIHNKKSGESLSPVKFRELLIKKTEILDMQPEFMDRYLNENFSGGEKKRMEILQMLVLEPQLVILDEVDSGLDIDALKKVSDGINWLRQKNPKTALLIITHHAGILHHLKPDFVHIMKDGKIVKSGGFEVAQKLEKSGYKG